MVNTNKKQKQRKNNRSNEKNKIKHVKDPANNPVGPEEAKDESNSDTEKPAPKRHFAEDTSDVEDEPKRKKKKKQPVQSDSSDKKGQKSIRQIKREKHAERIASKAAVSKDQLKSQCISYLSQWKHDKQNWKFMKVKQVWLYKNKFSSYLLPDSSWPVFLEYFESAKGNIKNLLLEDANKIIKQMDEWTESQTSTGESLNEKDENEEEERKKSEGPVKPDDTAYKRARDLIQCLQA